MNFENEIHIHSKTREMPSLVISDIIIKDHLGIKIESNNKSSDHFLFEQIDQKPNINKELFKHLKNAKYNIIQTKALSIIQSYYLSHLKDDLTEQIFIAQIGKILKDVKNSLLYKKGGKLCLYKDFKERLRSTEIELFKNLGTLLKERFNQPTKKQGSTSLNTRTNQ